MGNRLGLNRSTPANRSNQMTVESNGTYFGPNFIFNNNGTPIADGNAVFFEEILNILAGNTISTNSMTSSLPPPTLRNTKTLKASVNLMKNSIRLKQVDDGKYVIEFQFDSTTKCMIKIYYAAREIHKQHQGHTRYEFTWFNRRMHDNNGNICVPEVYGPFQPGFDQTFRQGSAFDISNYINIYSPTELATSPASTSAPSATTALLPATTPSATTNGIVAFDPKPTFYPIIVCIESIGENDDEVDNIHMQASFISFVTSEALPKLKIIKQSMLINGNSYVLQEIFGFSEQQDDTGSMNGALKDCIICMAETKDTVVLPCRHLCLCGSCAEVLRMQGRGVNSNQQSSGPPKCPICRRVFHSLLQINLPEPFVTRNSRLSSRLKLNESHCKIEISEPELNIIRTARFNDDTINSENQLTT